MTQPGGQRRDQVFTGDDTFDFGTSRASMERILRARAPVVITSADPGRQPAIAGEQGQKLLVGAVFSAYFGGPILARIARKKKARARARRDAEDGGNADQ
jgi:hypothetical protein